MSVILGALLSHSQGHVYVQDSTPSDVPELVALLKSWQASKKVYLVAPLATQYNWTALEANFVTHATPGEKDCMVYFESFPLLSAKDKEWHKVDTDAVNKVAHYFGGTNHVILATHVNSKIWWDSHLNVYSLGSIHNMFAFVANFDMKCAASSFSYQNSVVQSSYSESNPPHYATCLDYIRAVANHNAVRNMWYLFSRYQYNPQLNFIVPRQRDKMAFTEGQLEEDDCADDFEEQQDLDEEAFHSAEEEEPDSEPGFTEEEEEESVEETDDDSDGDDVHVTTASTTVTTTTTTTGTVPVARIPRGRMIHIEPEKPLKRSKKEVKEDPPAAKKKRKVETPVKVEAVKKKKAKNPSPPVSESESFSDDDENSSEGMGVDIQ